MHKGRRKSCETTNRSGFKFNEHGVCLNPTAIEIVPAKDKNKWWTERATIMIARDDEGRYIYGYGWCLDAESGSGPCIQGYRRTFDSVEACILDYIGSLEEVVARKSKRAVRQEWDDNGNEVIIDNSKKYRGFSKALAAKKEYYSLPRLF